MTTTDLIVKCHNPAALDNVMQSFCALVQQDGDLDNPQYIQKDGGYVVRCFGNVNFIKFVIENQGYGEVIGELDVPLKSEFEIQPPL